MTYWHAAMTDLVGLHNIEAEPAAYSVSRTSSAWCDQLLPVARNTPMVTAGPTPAAKEAAENSRVYCSERCPTIAGGTQIVA